MAARPRKIMVGYDGSDVSRRALDAAADLVGYGSTLSVVTVKNGEVGSRMTGDAHARLLDRNVEARYHETTGEPAEQLVEKATELGADLVVVGGSASSRVVRHAPCDVLVVR
jgi:nucleotide-binding universal stress UspA family protein